ncbi:MAG: NAD(+)/NADH kinase [Thermodesulfobacteriota bacterium]
MPKPVGLIANPASGKDIRRLVAHGSVFDNQEKINIIRRVLKALDSVGIDRVYVMPDFAGLGPRAIDDLEVSLKVSLLPLKAEGTQDDSTIAAAMLAEMDVGCIITLGGDGTNRVVAKTCGDVPLVPISTGTNNVFPYMVEGTLAGLAAGVVAAGLVEPARVCRRAPRLELWHNGACSDVALIDVVVTDYDYVGLRAIWEPDSVKEIFLSRARPAAIGFSSIGGYIHPLPPDSGQGLHVTLGSGQGRVRSPIAPGLIRWLPIAAYRVFKPGDEIIIDHAPAVIALDGEREVSIRSGEKWSVRISREGPWVVDIEQALEAACECRLFHDGD